MACADPGRYGLSPSLHPLHTPPTQTGPVAPLTLPVSPRCGAPDPTTPPPTFMVEREGRAGKEVEPENFFGGDRGRGAQGPVRERGAPNKILGPLVVGASRGRHAGQQTEGGPRVDGRAGGSKGEGGRARA